MLVPWKVIATSDMSEMSQHPKSFYDLIFRSDPSLYRLVYHGFGMVNSDECQPR